MGQGTSQILVYAVVLIALSYPLGIWMARVYTREKSDIVERGFLRLVGRDASSDQNWKQYGLSVIVFSIAFSVFLYGLLRLQGHLFLNPRSSPRGAVDRRAQHDRELRDEHELAVLRRRGDDVVPQPDGRSRGAAASSRPVSGSPSSPRSSAASRAVAEVSGSGTSGATSTASIVYILLPLAIVLAVILIAQGVPQTFHGHATAHDAPGRAPGDRARPRRVAWSRSSSSGRTAAATTTRTPPFRSRTRRRSRTSSRCWRSC